MVKALISRTALLRTIWRRTKITLVLTGLLAVIAIGVLVYYEANTSHFQARVFTELGREMTYKVEKGPSDSIRFSGRGPFDLRLGYAYLPQYLARLQTFNYFITDQARISPQMAAVDDYGLYTPYREKIRAGVTLSSCSGEPLHESKYPERIYGDFGEIPDILVNSLLFIENRELLDADYTSKNPAIEWGRFSKAVIDNLIHKIDPDHDAPGGSTLATQIEKYRHSPHGRTRSGREKLYQMASASLRAYLDGEDTTEVRRRLVTDYLNTVPLAAKVGYGEVIGIGDGMWAWYERDFNEVNRLLRDENAEIAQRALAYKQMLSLLISQRRPSGFLARQSTLEALTNSHLRILSTSGIISPELRDAALKQALRLHRKAHVITTPVSFIENKATNAVRMNLATMLGSKRLYDLDRLDLDATSTLNTKLQRAITDGLVDLATPAAAKKAGLMEDRLLSGANLAKVIYSFTLYERTEGANVVRVQADNFDQPFDINEGTRLDLGSTAKLRTLVTYLELVAKLHARLATLSPDDLAKVPIAKPDAITRWAIDYLKGTTDRDLKKMLDAAMARSYSASPQEKFFTGGGMLSFANFDSADNDKVLTLREGLKRSVNLVFIRLMRDIVRHTMFNMPSSSATLLDDENDPKRREYLGKFADREGKEFLIRFYKKYQGKIPDEAENILLQSIRPTPKRLAPIFRSIAPNAPLAEFAQFIHRSLPDTSIDQSVIAKLYDEYSPQKFDLADRGYLAGVHPLELWLLGYMRANPTATLKQIIEAGVDERQEVYGWLFKTRHRSAQDSRIKRLVEIEAFMEIHKMWKRLGYPFESLDPSYATALGSSADRPAALAELMGVLVNDGVHLPALRLDTIAFARDTPYETRLAYRSPGGEQALPKEVAQVARESLALVVEEGTAKRLRGVFTRPDGTLIAMGAKTGTGDHRFEVYGKGGALISSRVVSRSGTLVFYIGDRHFGTLTAYVKGPDAAKYKFTSALPAQILKTLAPKLIGEINRPLEDGTSCLGETPQAIREKEILGRASNTGRS